MKIYFYFRTRVLSTIVKVYKILEITATWQSKKQQNAIFFFFQAESLAGITTFFVTLEAENKKTDEKETLFVVPGPVALHPFGTKIQGALLRLGAD